MRADIDRFTGLTLQIEVYTTQSECGWDRAQGQSEGLAASSNCASLAICCGGNTGPLRPGAEQSGRQKVYEPAFQASLTEHVGRDTGTHQPSVQSEVIRALYQADDVMEDAEYLWLQYDAAMLSLYIKNRAAEYEMCRIKRQTFYGKQSARATSM